MKNLISHYERELDRIDSHLRNNRNRMSETERLIYIEKENLIREFLRQLNKI